MSHIVLSANDDAALVADRRFQILNLARAFSIETTPKQAQGVESFSSLLPAGTRIFIAFIPGERTSNIVDLAARLVADGMRPVPHIPARSLESRREFEDYARALHDVGVRNALVLAGGSPAPVGNLTSSIELLNSGVFEGLGYSGLFVAGHPDGSPDITPAALADALAFKNRFAERSGIPTTIVTQFAFDSKRVLQWAQAIGASGNRLPIRIGVAGPASATSLLKYAKMCGVNASMGMLAKAGGRLFRLVGQAAPDGLICELASKRTGWAELIQDIHYYPFGGFAKTSAWASALAGGAFTLHPDENGFSVQV